MNPNETDSTAVGRSTQIATFDQDLWQRVLRYLGDNLARFVLATDEAPADLVLTEKQAATASLLNSIFAESQLEAWNELRRWQDVAQRLCAFNPQLGRSAATHLHLLCGGELPDTSSSDAVEEALSRFAVDAYALFLIGGMDDGAHHHIPASLYRHPARSATLAAMFNSGEPLMQLFPHADFAHADFAKDPATQITLSSNVKWTNGQGGTIQFVGLPAALLLRATGAAKVGMTPLAAYAESVRETLAAARSLAKGKPTQIPAIVGCYSVSLAPGMDELQLAEGTFRRKTPMDHSLINGSPNEDVVLEIPVELQFAGFADDRIENWIREDTSERRLSDQFHDTLQSRITRARMAVALGSKDAEVLPVGQSFLSVPNPLTLGGSSGRSPLAWPVSPFQSRPLDAADGERIKEWDALLGDIPTGLRTGQERLLAAVSERFSPHDGFIDAVIVWENLFGSAGEAMLRVCGSLAAVLRPEGPARRAEFFKELKSIYGKRSRLVHGAENRIPASEAEELRNTAVHIAIAAWRAVLRNPELKSAKSSEERGQLVLIHGVK